MSLKNLKLPSVEIHVPGSDSFTVRGLSTVDLEAIYRKYQEAIVDIYERHIDSTSEPNWSALLTDTVKTAPRLMAEVIAVAAGEPDEVETVMAFTPGLQIKALERIGALTFSLETEGKNLIEIVAAFLENLNPLLGVVSHKLADLEVMKNAQQSTTGSGTSADK